MSNNSVVFHEEAAAEYEAAFDWYLERSRLAATKFADDLSQTLEAVVKAPQRWPIHTHGTRRILLRHFPFILVYREHSSYIQVIAVAHGRRRPGYWKQRL
jgi:plasmid stabilization system protein ParE